MRQCVLPAMLVSFFWAEAVSACRWLMTLSGILEDPTGRSQRRSPTKKACWAIAGDDVCDITRLLQDPTHTARSSSHGHRCSAFSSNAEVDACCLARAVGAPLRRVFGRFGDVRSSDRAAIALFAQARWASFSIVVPTTDRMPM